MISILLILTLTAEIWLLWRVDPEGYSRPAAKTTQMWLCFLVFLTFCAIIHFLD